MQLVMKIIALLGTVPAYGLVLAITTRDDTLESPQPLRLNFYGALSCLNDQYGLVPETFPPGDCLRGPQVLGSVLGSIVPVYLETYERSEDNREVPPGYECNFRTYTDDKCTKKVETIERPPCPNTGFTARYYKWDCNKVKVPEEVPEDTGCPSGVVCPSAVVQFYKTTKCSSTAQYIHSVQKTVPPNVCIKQSTLTVKVVTSGAIPKEADCYLQSFDDKDCTKLKSVGASGGGTRECNNADAQSHKWACNRRKTFPTFGVSLYNSKNCPGSPQLTATNIAANICSDIASSAQARIMSGEAVANGENSPAGFVCKLFLFPFAKCDGGPFVADLDVCTSEFPNGLPIARSYKVDCRPLVTA